MLSAVDLNSPKYSCWCSHARLCVGSFGCAVRISLRAQRRPKTPTRRRCRRTAHLYKCEALSHVCEPKPVFNATKYLVFGFTCAPFHHEISVSARFKFSMCADSLSLEHKYMEICSNWQRHVAWAEHYFSVGLIFRQKWEKKTHLKLWNSIFVLTRAPRPQFNYTPSGREGERWRGKGARN